MPRSPDAVMEPRVEFRRSDDLIIYAVVDRVVLAAGLVGFEFGLTDDLHRMLAGETGTFTVWGEDATKIVESAGMRLSIRPVRDGDILAVDSIHWKAIGYFRMHAAMPVRQ